MKKTDSALTFITASAPALSFSRFKSHRSSAAGSLKSVTTPILFAILGCSLVLAGTLSAALGATPVLVSITPVATSIDVGESVIFNSTLTGATIPYSYTWFLNGTITSETGTSWTFKPPTSGTYSVHLRASPSINDTAYNTAQSETAQVIVGGKSFIGVFGYPNGSSQASGSGTQHTVDGTRFSLNVESNATSISCLMDYQTLPYDPTLNYTYAFAIYGDNNGTVGELMAQTVHGTMYYYDNYGPLWYTLDFPSVVQLPPAAYWLVAVNNGTGQIMISSDVKAGYDSISSFIDGMAFPSSLPSPIPTSSYVFCIYASWAVNFSASLSAENNDFFIVSNSTVLPLTYDSDSNQVNFNVSGSSDTTGYSQAFISKGMLPEADDATVTFDGEKQNCTATSLGDSWVLHFTYSHSTHAVTIRLGESGDIPGSPDGADENGTEEMEPFPTTLIIVSVIAVAAAGLGLLVYLKKRHRSNDT